MRATALIGVLITLSLLTMTSAQISIGEEARNEGDAVILEAPIITEQPTNFTVQNVNSSDFWDDLDDPSDIFLNDLGDVIVPSPTTGFVLKFNGTDWVAAEDAGNDTQKGTSATDIYLFNDTATIFFNDTQLNITISSIVISKLVNVAFTNQTNIFQANQTINGSLNASSIFASFFNWVTDSIYLIFDGFTLTLNETRLNDTIDDRITLGVLDDDDWNVTGLFLFPSDLDRDVSVGTVSAQGKFHVATSEVIFQQNITLGSNASGHYRFEEGSGSLAIDSSGHENGTILGPTYESSKGANGTGSFALKFDGSGDTVLIPDNVFLDLNGNLSFGAWVNFTQSSTGADRIIDKQGSSTGYYMQFQGNEKIKCWVDSDSIISISTFDDGQWHHVVCVNGPPGTVRIYVDGVLEGTSGVGTQGDITNNADVYIGSDGGLGNFIDGLIDEVFFFNKSLDASEILDIFNTGVSGGQTVVMNLTKNVDPFVVKDGGVGVGTATPSHEMNIVGDLNVTGTIYYESLVAQSPHVFEPDESGFTRQCWYDKVGSWNLVYFDGGRQIVEADSLICQQKKSRIDALREEVRLCELKEGVYNRGDKTCYQRSVKIDSDIGRIE